MYIQFRFDTQVPTNANGSVSDSGNGSESGSSSGSGGRSASASAGTAELNRVRVRDKAVRRQGSVCSAEKYVLDSGTHEHRPNTLRTPAHPLRFSLSRLHVQIHVPKTSPSITIEVSLSSHTISLPYSRFTLPPTRSPFPLPSPPLSIPITLSTTT